MYRRGVAEALLSSRLQLSPPGDSPWQGFPSPGWEHEEMPRILAASRDGLRELDDRAVPGAVHHAGRAVTTVVQGGKQLWAIVDGSEVWHTAEGDGWTHLGDLEHHQGTCL